MDLGAYVQIEDLEHVMKENGIEVPRLRGLRLMKDEERLSKEDYDEYAKSVGFDRCKDAIEEDYRVGDWRHPYLVCYSCDTNTDRRIMKYLELENPQNVLTGEVKRIRWEKVHGKLRKRMKYELKWAKRDTKAQYDAFNRYVGMDDVLYIHARIGGSNWNCFGGEELKKQPWFLEKVDDAWDDTYCDIYAKITKGQEHE